MTLCRPGANRTRNLQLRRLLLYPLSYGPQGFQYTKSGTSIQRTVPGGIADSPAGGDRLSAASSHNPLLRQTLNSRI